MGHFAVDAALDQVLFAIVPDGSGNEFRALLWTAALALQFFLIRHHVLAWAGLDVNSNPQELSGAC
jgi:hypothetical protein